MYRKTLASEYDLLGIPNFLIHHKIVDGLTPNSLAIRSDDSFLSQYNSLILPASKSIPKLADSIAF